MQDKKDGRVIHTCAGEGKVRPVSDVESNQIQASRLMPAGAYKAPLAVCHCMQPELFVSGGS